MKMQEHDTGRHAGSHANEARHPTGRRYLRFAAMILTSVFIMYWVMYAGSWEPGHMSFSESRVFMSITMGGTMALVMLAWMRDMYRNARANIAVVALSIVLIVVGIMLDRSVMAMG